MPKISITILVVTALDALHSYFGYDSFRPMQEEIIQSVLAKRDTLALLPTGGGKSLCFQIPTLVWASETNVNYENGTSRSYRDYENNENYENYGNNGTLCLVVSPLIALMKDQVEHLRGRGILAAAIYTGQTLEQQDTIIENCIKGPYRFLYVSPERLESEAFRERLSYLPICLIAVDEAHCISQWGYDFRPSYLHIAAIRDMFPAAPVIALTATATPDVVADIQRQLHFASPHVLQSSFQRPNISYVVRRCPIDHRGEEIVHILQRVRGSSIVYVRNRKRTVALAQYLQQCGLKADYYHAGLPADIRSAKQEQWRQTSSCIVTTNAFGMGIDKPDVRVVIHHDLPDTLEAYFQEAGRAGRDEKPAYAVLLYDEADKTKARQRIGNTYPSPELISKVYHCTADFLGVAAQSGEGDTYLLQTDDLIRIMRLPPIETYSALQLLTQAGYICFQADQEIRPRILLRVSRAELSDYRLSSKQWQLLESIMRHYPGVFTELQYLHRADSVDHELLVSLAKRHIITYIPRSISSTLTFTKDRQKEVFIPPSVYTEQRLRYIDKLRSMVEYAENTTQCRSTMLLRYFGETQAPACGKCDVCRAEAKTTHKKGGGKI